MAKIIRILSVPPVVASSLFSILFVKTKNIFADVHDFLVSIFCVGVLPILSYLVHSIVPTLRKAGRNGQRKLAFVFSGIGYVIFYSYSVIKSNCTLFFRQISSAYIVSVFTLVVFNKFLNFKMSGHAASIAAPIIFLVYHLGILPSVPCSILFLLVLWASVKTRQHTIFQFLSGGICSATSFFISTLVYRA